jgi:catechol 2,3-dioxygenase-like lactoylglutathione lyase family enzyme
VKLSHISVTARDAKALARFYRNAFGMTERRPAKRLSGEVIARGNGLPGAEITSIWLDFPGGGTPFLEIMEYSQTAAQNPNPINAPGFAHIALEVTDLHATLDRLQRFGGTLQGEVIALGAPDRPHLCVYTRDPEGNVLELEQPPQRGPA